MVIQENLKKSDTSCNSNKENDTQDVINPVFEGDIWD
jgi:hypothetical protein